MSNLLHEARIKLDWAGDNLTQLKFVIQQVAQDASNAVVDDSDASRKKIFFSFTNTLSQRPCLLSVSASVI
jgi:hypothetical protein